MNFIYTCNMIFMVQLHCCGLEKRTSLRAPFSYSDTKTSQMKLLQCIFVVSILAFWLPMIVLAHEELRIVAPATLAERFWKGMVPVSPALFGIPNFQSSLHGRIIRSVPNDGCSAIDKQASGFPNGKSIEHLDPVILLIDRGNCTFTQKIRHSQDAGGVVSVIIVDDRDELDGKLPLMADDGTGQNLVLPSVMISNRNGQEFKDILADTNAKVSIVVELTYRLPRPDNRVEIDLWTSSWDPLSLPLRRNFGPAVKSLGTQALFTAYYYIVPGEAFGCDRPPYACGNQCTNEGRYCTWDPERDTTRGLSGSQVLEEDLRRICLYDYLNNTLHDRPLFKWFDYVNKFEDACSDKLGGDFANWNRDCSFSAMHAFGIDTGAVQNCFDKSGGTHSGPNSMFELQRNALDNYGGMIVRIPWLLINNAPFYGSMQCGSPLNQVTCGPLNAICHGFEEGSEPSSCDASYDFECNYDGYMPFPPEGMCQNDSIFHKDGFYSGQLFGLFVAASVALGGTAFAVYWYMRRERDAMRDDIDALLKQYLPLDGRTIRLDQHQRLLNDADDEQF